VLNLVVCKEPTRALIVKLRVIVLVVVEKEWLRVTLCVSTGILLPEYKPEDN
jgi:hypothetical protein